MNRPKLLTEPDPLVIDQVKLGCVPMAVPNWSPTTAASCSVPLLATVGEAGVTVMPLAVC